MAGRKDSGGRGKPRPKPRRWSDADIREVLRTYVDLENLREACRRHGVKHHRTAQRWLEQERWVQEVERLRRLRRARARDAIAAAADHFSLDVVALHGQTQEILDGTRVPDDPERALAYLGRAARDLVDSIRRLRETEAELGRTTRPRVVKVVRGDAAKEASDEAADG